MATETGGSLLPLYISAGRRVAGMVQVLTAVCGGRVKYRITREQAIEGIRAGTLHPLGGRKPKICAVIEAKGPDSPLLGHIENREHESNLQRGLPKFTTRRDDWDNPRGILKHKRMGRQERLCVLQPLLSCLDQTNRGELLKAIQRQER